MCLLYGPLGFGLGEIYFLTILLLVLAIGIMAHSNFQVHPPFNEKKFSIFLTLYLSYFAVRVQVSVTVVTA